ncbi:MAC/perforin domain-containing protein [Pontibaca salina]|uniref:MACPF domain-containing protein n=1 Tax=Pontibaca salina TaxID=2795731 RepID=A0A934HMV6_9RHOB|nr:MAC/perforin domain-containing protein [Pontibaca salina]MBI6628282.1 hypothetical protein [Pontibaca salina]
MTKAESFEMYPIQMTYNQGIQIGYGINPVTGNQTTMRVGGITPFPTESPGGMQNTKIKWSFIQTQSQYSTSWGIEGSVSGNYGLVKGSMSASYSTQEAYSSSQVVLSATCVNMDGQYMMDPEQPGLDVSNVLSEIEKQGSYDKFVAKYGTHFVAGVIYGSEYIASYTTTYETSSEASNAQVALSTSYNGVVSSGSITSDYTITATSQAGYSSIFSNQTNAGAFTPAGPANPDTINANLAAFPGTAKGLPLWYVLWDWREIPEIAAAAGESEINWAQFYNNLSSVQNTLSSLVFNQSSAQSAKAIGATSMSNLSAYITNAQAAIDEVLTYGPQDVADFNATTYAPTVDQITNIVNISDGMATVRLTATTDDSFDQNPPPPVQGNYLPSDKFVAIDVKKGSKTWAFGFIYSKAGDFTVRMGQLKTAPDNFDSSWQGTGTLIYSSIDTSVTVPLSNGAYPWITATVQVL